MCHSPPAVPLGTASALMLHKVTQLHLKNVHWPVCVCGSRDCIETYLQSDITELATLSQSVHFGHGGIQESLILKDQITVWNHLG